jgi:PAS domain S-box-containing protein
MRELTILSPGAYRPGARDKTIEFMDRLEVLDLLEAIATRAGQLLGTADGYIYVIEPASATLEIKVGVGLFKEYVGARHRLSSQAAADLWQSHHLLIEDYDQWPGRVHTFAGNGGHRLLAVPLQSATQVVGVLCLVFGESGAPFTAEDLRLLERFAELASLALEIALDNARLYLSAQQELAERQRAEAALRRESAFVKLLQQVAVAANEATSWRDAFQFALNHICDFTGWPVGHVYLLSGGTEGELVSTNIWYVAEPKQFAPFQETSETISLAQEVGLPSWVLARGRSVWVDDVSRIPGFQRFRQAQEVGLHAAFAFPVMVGRDVVAVLEFYATGKAEPDEALLDVVGHIANQLGRVIERQQAEDQVRRAAARAEALAHMAARLNSQTDLGAVLQTVCEETARTLDVPVATVSLYDEANQVLRYAYAYGLPSEFGQEVEPFAHALYEERAWQYGDVVVIPNMSLPPDRANAGLYRQYQFGTTASIGMVREGQLIGRLNAATLTDPGNLNGFRRFSEEEIALLRGLADLAAQAIANNQATARRQEAEQALRQSEERFRKIFEEGPFGMALLGLDQRFTRANPAFCQMLGYSEAELAGLTFLEMTHPDDRGRYNHLAEQMTEGKIPFYKIQKRYLKKNGEVVWVNLTRSMMRNDKGEPLYSLAMLEDITERKRAEEERDRFFTLSSDMLFIGSLDGYFRQVNNAWEKTLGYSPAELLKTPFFELIHPESLKAAVRELQTLGNDSSTLHYELRLRHRDGSYRWTSWTVTPYAQEGLIYGIGRDITERKLAEEDLRQARDELEQRVKERTAELEAANEEIRSFAYIVSHDLRAPLINLRGFAAELKRAATTIHDHIAPALLHLDEDSRYELGSALQEDIPEALDFIHSAVSRMDRLTSAILSLSRLGRRELLLEPIDMNKLVRETLNTLAHQIDQSEAQVTIGELPEVTADRTALEQIMGNLLANAVTYLLPDRPGHIDIRGERHEQETVFHVCDNGRGIAPADMSKLFQPFSRLGEPVAPGEGMGLAYVQTLVRRHGGRITCDSTIGVGTTFTFTISNRLNWENKDA